MLIFSMNFVKYYFLWGQNIMNKNRTSKNFALFSIVLCMIIQVVFIPCWAEASNTTDIDMEFIKGIDDSVDESIHKSVYDSVYAPIPASITELDEMHAIHQYWKELSNKLKI